MIEIADRKQLSLNAHDHLLKDALGKFAGGVTVLNRGHMQIGWQLRIMISN
jgi:hypothetical protein